MGFPPPGKIPRRCTTSPQLGNGTYKRGHGADEIDNDFEAMWTGDFFVTDLLADCEISQSEEVDVGIVSIIALHIWLSATQSFREHPSKEQHVQERARSLIPNAVGCSENVKSLRTVRA